jgi:hypothetical protein
MFQLLITYAREMRSWNFKGTGKVDHRPHPMVNVPELLFVFYVYCTARQSSHGYSGKNEPHCKFNANACLQVKCNSKRVSYVGLDQMRAIIDEYGPEFSSGDRDLPPTASANSIRRRFHCWNPGFHFAFFYCSFQNRWVPYLGVMGEKRRRWRMRKWWKTALRESHKLPLPNTDKTNPAPVPGCLEDVC